MRPSRGYPAHIMKVYGLEYFKEPTEADLVRSRYETLVPIGLILIVPSTILVLIGSRDILRGLQVDI